VVVVVLVVGYGLGPIARMDRFARTTGKRPRTKDDDEDDLGQEARGRGVSLVPPGMGRERRTIGERGTQDVRLFVSKRSMLGRPMRGLIQKRCKPGDESEFKAIDIEFFVVKKGIHPKNKTND
jgi:hypothetical protein